MRQITGALGLGALLLSGCDNWRFLHPNPPAERGIPVEALTADKLVQSLNANAQRIQALESHNVDLACSQGFQSFNLNAFMVVQKPRNFRLRAQVLNKTEVDVGSNDREFWWWIGRSDPPYLYHCSHQDFATSQGRIQLPFQPDWLIEALGMAEYDPRKAYQVVNHRNTVELVEQAVSPQGKPVQKVTLLSRTQNQVQVTGHLLKDAKGDIICSASVTAVQKAANEAILPRRVELRWPAEKIKMTMTINDVVVNGSIPQDRVASLFSRPSLKDVPSVDLARGMDAPSGPIRRAGVTFQTR
jgi:hypothetical protein